MTPTERAKRSDALYYETVSVTRRVLCDMIANREADLEDAQAENAKLVVKLNAEHLVRQNAERDNAKLRELAKKLVILAFARCADCDLFDASCALVPTQKCLLWNECESIARELGVEVDDG